MVLYLGGQLREQFQVVGRGDGGGHPRLLKYGILFLKHTFFIAFLHFLPPYKNGTSP